MDISFPSMALYKSGAGSVYQSWCKEGPDEATYTTMKIQYVGWFEMDKFKKWTKQV